MGGNAPRLISRSSHEAMGTCPRRFYFNFEMNGTGYDSSTPAMPLLIGLGVHKGLEWFFKIQAEHGATESEAFWVLAAGEAKEEFEKQSVEYKLRFAEDARWMSELEEGALLCFALVYGWLSTRAKDFLEEFEILQVEKELRTPLSSDVTLMSRLDLLVRSRRDGLNWVINWKTASSNDPAKMHDKYRRESQMWAEALAAEQDISEPVQGTILEVLYKGVRRSGSFSNPLLYAYAKDGKLKSDYTKGWAKVRADQLEMGMVAWIDSLDREILSKHFFRPEPILKINSVVEDRLELWVHREGEALHILTNGSERDKLKHFQPREGEWCNWCPFQGPCFGESTMEELIEAGRLVPRADHHALPA